MTVLNVFRIQERYPQQLFGLDWTGPNLASSTFRLQQNSGTGNPEPLVCLWRTNVSYESATLLRDCSGVAFTYTGDRGRLSQEGD